MNKLYPPLTILTVDGKPFVEGFTKEKPINKWKNSLEHTIYQESVKKWESSKVRYPVSEDSINIIREEWSKTLSVTEPNTLNRFDLALEKRIDISHLSERIILVSPDPKSITQFEPFVKLKPIQEDESQEDIWNDLLNVWTEASMSDSKIPVIRVLKSKFTITRNQP